MAILRNSEIGKELVDLILSGPGIRVVFWDSSGGENLMGNIVSIPDPNNSKYGPDLAARIFAHEAVHVLQRAEYMRAPLTTSIEAEREAYMVQFAIIDQLSGGSSNQKRLSALATNYASAEKEVLSYDTNGVYTYWAQKGPAQPYAPYNKDWEIGLHGLGFSTAAITDIRHAAGLP
jgi:hypothetical protein